MMGSKNDEQKSTPEKLVMEIVLTGIVSDGLSS